MAASTMDVSLPPYASRVDATLRSVLPRRLVRFREIRQLQQKELAARAGISRSQLNIIEGGQARDVLCSTIERIGEAMLVTPDALLGYEDLDLVRQTIRPGLLAPMIRDTLEPRECPACTQLVHARSLHLKGDCMVFLCDRGISHESIAARFGLSCAAVEFILREEFETRRHRRW